jgi:N-acetylneuraminate lyase
MLLEALAIGADTFIGSTYGYNAPIYNKIIEAFNAGEMKKAADLQYKANVLITFLGKYGNGTGKAFMKAADMDLGPVRRPFRNLTEEEYQKFLAEIKAEDFDMYKCVLK